MSVTRILKSLARIGFVVVVTVAVLWAAAAVFARQPTFVRRPFRPKLRSDAGILRRHVEFLSIQVRPRDVEHLANLDAAAEYIKAAFAKSSGRVTEQTFDVRERTFRNVICDFGPADPSRPLLIVGAHYDAFSMTGNLPGADDNASGTAGLLELARLLGAQPPSDPVQLVAFTTEEPPFFASDRMGSAMHADSLLESDRNVKAMLCLEMIGYFRGDQRWDSQFLGLLYPRRGDFIGVAGGWDDRNLARLVKSSMRAAGGPPVVSFTGPRSMSDASDQRNYWSRGFKAVMITDTAYLRNPNYHTAGDTPDTLDYPRMAGVVDGVMNAILELQAR